MPSDIPNFDAFFEKGTRKPRKGSIYTPQERAILGQYKKEYRSKATREERLTLLKTKILVDIFNHWKEKGIVLDEDESRSRIKQLGGWISNNWRPKKAVHTSGRSRKKSHIDVVWDERREEVLEEIKNIVGTTTPTDRENFIHRTAAASAVYERLSEGEKRRIKTTIDRGDKHVNPPEIQQKRAKKLAAATLLKFSEERWRDMGMLSVTFYVYTDKDNKLTGDIFENMSALTNSQFRRRFQKLHRQQSQDMLKKVIEYVKMIKQGMDGSNRNATGGTPPVGIVDAAGSTLPAGGIGRCEVENGFPKMPQLVENRESLRKTELESVLREYLSAHYKLASGYRRSHVHFSGLKTNTSAYVDRKYLPLGMTLKDPRNMGKEEILDLMDHIHQREIQSGVEDAFRFKQYYNGKGLVLADYGTNTEDDRADNRPSNAAHTQRPTGQGRVAQATSDTAAEQARPNTPLPNTTLPSYSSTADDNARVPSPLPQEQLDEEHGDAARRLSPVGETVGQPSSMPVQRNQRKKKRAQEGDKLPRRSTRAVRAEQEEAEQLPRRSTRQRHR